MGPDFHVKFLEYPRSPHLFVTFYSPANPKNGFNKTCIPSNLVKSVIQEVIQLKNNL